LIVGLININNDTPLAVQTRALELALQNLERAIGASVDNENVTPDGIWQTLKAMYFTVPLSPSQMELSEAERDAQLAQWLRMSKTAFLKRIQLRLMAVKRRSAQKQITGK
jgi:hypothetical protein